MMNCASCKLWTRTNKTLGMCSANPNDRQSMAWSVCVDWELDE